MSNLPKLLARGGALVRQGDIAGARAEFERAARDHTRNAEPWISLAAVHGMQGNYAEALRCARKAVELAPHSLQAWVNLGNAAQHTGELTQAAEAFQRARGLPGCPADIVLQLGLTLAQLGRWMEAEKPLREYLVHHPGHREATLRLARILTIKGETAAAAAMTEEYCRRHSGDTRALLQLGAIYLDQGRLQDAWRLCDQAMRESAGAAEALLFKGTLLTFEGRHAAAREVYEQLARLQPDNPQTLIMLSLACYQSADPDAGLAYARTALKANPRTIDDLTSLGNIFMMTDPAESRRLMEKALTLAPDDPRALVLRGQVLEFEGDKQGAWSSAFAAIERGSVSTEAVVVAANVAPSVGRTEEAIGLLEQVVARAGISATNQRALHFALANLCDKAKQYDRAFDHAVIANRLKNVPQNIHHGHLAQINSHMQVYAATAIASLPRSTVRSELPVFIVGMPRSGTSLVEQILSCHSKVHARGETTDIEKLADQIPYYPDGVRNLAPEKLNVMAGAYVQRLHDMAPSATRVTDKLPGNYMYLGIISQLFPGARVLHCKRDPRDICLSNYFIDFGAGLGFTYDLEALAYTYKAYQELMEHWKAMLPIPILDVQYEELVEEPRSHVEAILKFCGLEWEDACLDFHQSKRQVMTASYDQVRRPLYKSSKARWKNYARQLEPVSRILGLKDDA
ncbi:sulfotransferase [Sulfuricaulis limicola]|uniref:Sulfotransferase n=1 Tax=Sulfuricaulis limicola TaxID=1620215 RepID=A0A1B4XGG0_9GAMM|nr:tetratricopeptide repeat-containing sulfotransferase family protein [Sulfuricaulis limicola]BAV33885.1 sulfotransferase [Sulfuricaulis limicola]